MCANYRIHYYTGINWIFPRSKLYTCSCLRTLLLPPLSYSRLVYSETRSTLYDVHEYRLSNDNDTILYINFGGFSSGCGKSVDIPMLLQKCFFRVNCICELLLFMMLPAYKSYIINNRLETAATFLCN